MKILNEEQREKKLNMLQKWKRNNRITDADIALSNVNAYLASAESAVDKLADALYELGLDDGRCDETIKYLKDTRKKMIPFLEDRLEKFKEEIGYTE